jgi:hypothetical protein
MEYVNPFRYGAPVAGESFCDRRDELAALTGRMRSGVHAFVLSPRRYGKTSLLLEALSRFRRRGGRGGYANLLLCTTPDEVAAVVLNGVVREAMRPVGRARQSLEEVIRRLRVTPTVKATPDGGISLSFDPSVGSARWSEVLEDAGGLLEEAAERRPAALVLDEFQQVAEVGEHGVGGAFKALADQVRHASLVFSGSHLSVMERLTVGRGAPLLGMGETFRLGVVPEQEMAAHLVERTASAGKVLSEATARELYRRADGIPNDVQWLAHGAFEAAGRSKTITSKTVEAALTAVVNRQAGMFAERYEALSPAQRRIVRELAKGPVEQVYAKVFLDRVRVANANAVTTALRVLADREFVRRGEARWQLASPFFRAWLLAQLHDH